MSGTPGHVVEVDALGARIAVSVSDGEVADAFRRAWAPCLAAPFDGDGVPRGQVTDEDLADRAPELVLELLTQRVTIEAIELRAGELLMFHACAVANAAGEAVVMVGPSGMGKTTMARTHGQRWGYVTDETAAVTDEGRLIPYPKPLSLTRPGQVKAQVSREEAGLMPAGSVLRPRAVLLLERGEDTPEVEVEPVATVPAVALLAEHTSYLARMHRPLARIADLLHETGGLRRVRYAEAGDLAPLLGGLLGGSGGVGR